MIAQLMVYTIISASCIGFGIYYLISISSLGTELITIVNSSKSRIDEIDDKEGEKLLEGYIRCINGQGLSSPLSQRNCVAYSSHIKDTSDAFSKNIYEEDEIMDSLKIVTDERDIPLDTDNISLILNKNVVSSNNKNVQRIVDKEYSDRLLPRNISAREGFISDGQAIRIYGNPTLAYRQEEQVVSGAENSTLILTDIQQDDLIKSQIKKSVVHISLAILIMLVGIVIIFSRIIL